MDTEKLNRNYSTKILKRMIMFLIDNYCPHITDEDVLMFATHVTENDYYDTLPYLNRVFEEGALCRE